MESTRRNPRNFIVKGGSEAEQQQPPISRFLQSKLASPGPTWMRKRTQKRLGYAGAQLKFGLKFKFRICRRTAPDQKDREEKRERGRERDLSDSEDALMGQNPFLHVVGLVLVLVLVRNLRVWSR